MSEPRGPHEVTPKSPTSWGSLTYEEALEKLDNQLKLLEEGNLSLEDALKAVDEARVYLKICTERLEAARKKIEVRAETEPTE